MTAALNSEVSYLPFLPKNSRLDLGSLAEHAERCLALRDWERHHLPFGDSKLGYELFMNLPRIAASGDCERLGFLKRLYLTLPYSEKGVRIHLRRLEAEGWITVHKAGKDMRSAQVELSARYWWLLAEYAERCRQSGDALKDLLA